MEELGMEEVGNEEGRQMGWYVRRGGMTRLAIPCLFSASTMRLASQKLRA